MIFLNISYRIQDTSYKLQNISKRMLGLKHPTTTVCGPERKQMIPVTPRGFKDVLPEEARLRESIVNSVTRTLQLWGYAPIETPTLEVLDVLEQGGELTSTPFRLFDTDNELLVLRPDVTLQVARMVASRLDDAALPLRLRYVESVFREEESRKAAARQFTQIGVESLGLAGSAADAEVILMAIDALDAAQLNSFTIALGTVGVLRELLDACMAQGRLDEQWRTQMLSACHRANVVEIDRLAGDSRVDKDFTEALRSLHRINGKGEAIATCKVLVEPLGCTDGLDQLAATWDIIEGVGATERVNVDFSVISSYDYYTGLVFEAYAPGLGVPLGSGGRYDRMMLGFGRNAPAAGFAFSLEAVMFALMSQGVDSKVATTASATYIPIDNSNPALAFTKAAELRASGERAILKVEQL
jgi:ATP phosphoribosyltransferase regulatory subunit